MSIFRFRKFSVDSGDCAMKVGTDAVILGAAVTLPSCEKSLSPASQYAEDESFPLSTSDSVRLGIEVLDAGCGSGVIGLMVAQRLEAAGFREYDVTGVEIDTPAAEQAERNFGASPWSGHLKCLNVSMLNFAPETAYDLIVSNPPYYDDSLLPPDSRRSTARHTGGDAFGYPQLLEFASEHLRAKGILALILPHQELTRLLRLAASYGLHATRLLHVRTTPSKEPSRLVAEFTPDTTIGNASSTRDNCGKAAGITPAEEYLTIQDASRFTQNKNSWTDEYLALAREFYL
jgi:tRNA1Val (adenine37-N6)-methyltransferase